MSILARILQRTADDLRLRKKRAPLSLLESHARERPLPLDVLAALRRGPDERIRVIAEIKRASPSAGPIRPGADPEDIAQEYEAAGASAISVLTEEPHFDGRLEFLQRVREVVRLPLLRKDFIIDPYQVIEARAASADALLLIVAALDVGLLRELYAATREQGMTALVEVHDEAEAARAADLGAKLIGVNHRNLSTFDIDLTLTGRLKALLPASTVLVAESGLRTTSDLQRMTADGAHAVLIGESLMSARSPGAALESLLEGL